MANGKKDSTENDKIKDSFDNNSDTDRGFLPDDIYLFVDRNLRAIRYTLYGVGAVGLLVVARSLHIHKKFSHLSEIPKEFISKTVSIRGRVKVLDKEHRLHVEHEPIFISRYLPINHSDSLLPVSLGGVELNPLGSKWLADNVLHRMVKITPLQLSEDQLISIVSLEKGILRRSVNVNKMLVQQGICKVKQPCPIPTSPAYLKLLDQLIAEESRADKKGTGLWGLSDAKPAQKRQWLHKIWTWLSNKFGKRKSL